MAGSYRKLKNGKWELCVSLGFDIKGKRIRKFKHIEASGIREVEKLLAEFITQCTRKNYNEYANLTLKEYYNLWMTDYAEESLRKKTISRYKTLWPRINHCLGHFKMPDIRPTHLIEFYRMLKEDGVRLDGKDGGLSPTTIKHHHALISTILETAVSWEMIDSNPCSKIKLARLGISGRESRAKIEESIYSLEMVKELLIKIDSIKPFDIKYKAYMYLAIFTGCRREEILGIEWKDINFETCEIKIQRASQYTPEHGTFENDLKTIKSRRTRFVPEEIINVLSEYKSWWENKRKNALEKNIWNETDRLFIQFNGRDMHPDTPITWFRKFLNRNGLPYTTLHNFRHVYGSILLDMGMNINSVADEMGHATIQMLVNRYLHDVRKGSHETAKHMKNALLD